MPQINGVPYSWASLALNAGGTQYYQAKSASYANDMERGVLEGTAQNELGVTKGKYKPSAAFELALDDGWSFRKQLGDGYMNQQFHVTLSFGADDNSVTHTVEYDAKLAKDAWDGSSGTDPMYNKFDLKVIGRIVVDGLDPIGQASA